MVAGASYFNNLGVPCFVVEVAKAISSRSTANYVSQEGLDVALDGNALSAPEGGLAGLFFRNRCVVSGNRIGFVSDLEVGYRNIVRTILMKRKIEPPENAPFAK